MPIPYWPKEDQPREKLLSKGAAFLTDAELIAILLGSGFRGKTALDIAKDLLGEHQYLKKLLLSPPPIFLNKNGIGQAKYALLMAAVELGKRFLAEEIPPKTMLNNSRRTQKFLTEKLQHHVNEVFACLFIDHHLRLIAFEELFFGTINEANVYPREIVRRGLHHNAAKIVLAHNHPSGESSPSEADKYVTQLIKQALQLVDMEVIDHIIVGSNQYFSFAEMGLI